MAEYLVTGPNGEKYKVTAPDNTPEWQIRQQVQSQIDADMAPQPQAAEEPGFFGAVGNSIARFGGRVATAYDNYMAEELAAASDREAELQRRRDSGEMSAFERALTWRPDSAPQETPEQLRNQAAGYLASGAERTQRFSEQFPMTSGGQQGMQALSEAETWGDVGRAVVEQPLNVLSAAGQVGLEQAPVLATSIAASALTRNPAVGVGIMGGATYTQERFGQMQEVASEFGYDLRDPAQARRAINDEQFLSAQEQRGMERGMIIATIDALTLKAGSMLPTNMMGLAGNTALQVSGGAGGEALAQQVTTGEVGKPGEVFLEGIAEGVSVPFDVAMYAAGNRGQNSESDIPPADPEQAQIDAQLQQEAEAQAQEETRTRNRDRLAAAPDFMPFKTFTSQRLDARRERIRDQNSEEGQAFLDWLGETRTATRPAPTTEAELNKEIDAYIKDTTPANDADVAFEEYNAALDEHIAFRTEQSQRTPRAQQQAEELKARLLEQRAAALAENDIQSLAEIERQANEFLLPGEWRYATLVADGKIKPQKGGLASPFTPQTEAPAQPNAPAASQNAGLSANESTDQEVGQAQPVDLMDQEGGVAPNVDTTPLPQTEAQTETASLTAPGEEAAPTAEATTDEAVGQTAPADLVAPEAGTAPEADTQSATPPVKDNEKGVVAEMRAYAVEKLGEDWGAIGGLSQEFTERQGFYKKTPDGRRKFEASVDAAAAELRAQEQEAAKAEAPVQETVQEPVQQEAEADQYADVRQNAVSFANEKLGENWQESQPELVDQLAANDFTGFQAGVEAAATQTEEAAAPSTEEENVAPTPVEPRELAVSQFDTDGLSQNQTAVWEVIRDAFQNNEADNVINPDGSFRFQNIAEIAKLVNRGGGEHTTKVGKRNAAQSALKQLRPKIAKSFNVTEEQLAEVLAATRKERQNVEAAADTNDGVSELDNADLAESKGYNIIESANQGARRGLSKEDIAYMEARSKEKDEYENKRQEIADKQRQKQNVLMVQQYGQTAIRAWNNMSSGSVPVAKLPKKDLMEWISVIEELENGQITQEQAMEDQKEIETRVSLDPNVKLEAPSGQRTIEGTTDGNAEGQNTGSEASAESGNPAEQVGTSYSGETGQRSGGQAKPVVVTKKKRVITKPVEVTPEQKAVEEAKPTAEPEPISETSRSATEEQRVKADNVAEALGGTVVYQNGDVALVQGYNLVSGRPVYVAARGDRYTKVDVEAYTGNEFTAQEVADLKTAKQSIEADAKAKHEADPFIKFEDGVAFSENVSDEYKGIVSQWTKLLGLKGEVYFTTLADAKANKQDFTGPHRAIGSATLNANEKGSARMMQDGSFYVVFDERASKAETLELIAHEMGHVHQKQAFNDADKGTKDTLIKAHQQWLKRQKGKTARELVNSLRARKTAKNTAVPEGMSADEASSYWKSFSEWYADQTSRWANTQEEPVGVVEKFFSRLGKAIKAFYAKAANKEYLPAQEFVDYLAAVKGKLSNAPVTPDADQQADAMSDKMERAEGIISVRKRKGREWVKKNFGDTTAQFYSGVVDLVTDPKDQVTFLYDLVERVQDKMPSVKNVYRAMKRQEEIVSELMLEAESIAARAAKLSTERYEAVNQFISRSTFFQKWGYDPEQLAPELFKGRNVKVDPTMAAEWNKLSADEKRIVSDIFAQGEKRRQRMQEFVKKLGVNGKLFTATSSLQGPYAPLKRFGGYAAVLRSKELMDLEAKVAEPSTSTPELKRKVNELKGNADHYVVQFFDTQGSADVFAEKNSTKNGGKFYKVESFPRGNQINNDRAPSTQILESLLGALKADEKSGLDDNAKESVRTMIREHYFHMMDERDARVSGAKRLNRAGYDKDMIKSFLYHSNAQARMISTMETGAEVNEALSLANAEARKDSGNLKPTYDLFSEHYTLLMRPDDGFLNKLQNSVAAVNTATMLTSNITYHIQNFTQVMVAVNKLYGDFNDYSGAWGGVVKGLRLASKAIKGGGVIKQATTVATMGLAPVDNSVEIDVEALPERYRPVVRELQAHQLADIGLQEDLRQFERFDTGFKSLNTANDFLKGVFNKLNQTARFVEAHIRLASAIAAFDMATKNPQRVRALKKDSAIEYAVSTVQRTQGAFNGLDAPLAFKKLPKLMTQYRKYQVMMAFNYARAVNQAFLGESPEIKWVGRRTLAVTLGHAAISSGVRGMPWVAGAGSLLMMFAGDDEEGLAAKAKAAGGMDNYIEMWLKDNIDNEAFATMVTRGVPAWLGVDFSGKLGHQNFFALQPYSDLEVSRDGLPSYIFDVFAGPTASQVRNIGAANEARQRGDYDRMVEYMMPKGLRQYLESYRFATQGMQFTNGEVMLDPRNIDLTSLMRNAIGLPDNEIQQLKWTRGQQIEMERYFSERQTRLTNEFVTARQDGNRERQSEIREEWMELQRAKRRVRPFFNNAPNALRFTPPSQLIRTATNRRRNARNDRRMLGTE